MLVAAGLLGDEEGPPAFHNFAVSMPKQSRLAVHGLVGF